MRGQLNAKQVDQQGVAGMADILRGGIAINEVLPTPELGEGFDTDGNGEASLGDEYVELINMSSDAIDISGLEFWDWAVGNWFTFPEGTVLEPGATALVVREVQPGGSLPDVTGDNLAFDAGFHTDLDVLFYSVESGVQGDNIVVYDPDQDEFIQANYDDDTVDTPNGDFGQPFPGFSSTATRVGSGVEFLGDHVPGLSIQRTSTGFVNDQTPTPGSSGVCFASGTRIATPDGFVPIEHLKVGDKICTMSSGPQPILWIFRREIGSAELRENPGLLPVIAPGETELRVSRQHRILVTGPVANRMFGANEVLVPAKDLVGSGGFELDLNARSLCYYHILLDAHHIINANGIAAESLYLGKEGVNAMRADARRELEIIFPAIGRSESFVPPALCRSSVSGRKARNLARRHEKNQRDLTTYF